MLKVIIKHLKIEKKIVDNDEVLNILNELGEKDRANKDLKRDYPDKIEELEVPPTYVGENYLKSWKPGFPDKWKFLTKQ